MFRIGDMEMITASQAALQKKAKMSEKFDELKRLLQDATPSPWENACDSDDPDDNEITTPDGSLIAFVQPHGNIRTVQRTGETFSRADARLIVTMRNTIEELLQSHDELEAWKRVFWEEVGIDSDEGTPEELRVHIKNYNKRIHGLLQQNTEDD
jgi:hypothetical protein